MKHKWHKEIKAWADGAEIEKDISGIWVTTSNPQWFDDEGYRIKPQPKEPQYLYVYKKTKWSDVEIKGFKIDDWHEDYISYLGKIKLEVDDE